jgi:hypothetical protein
VANLAQIYDGSQPVPGFAVHVGPIMGQASSGSVQVQVISGSGNPGAYDVEVSDSDMDYCTLFNRSTAGIAMWVLGSPVLFHRVTITRQPDPGTVVKVILVVGADQ